MNDSEVAHVWASFCAPIDEQSCHHLDRFMSDVTSLVSGPRHLHLRFQSSGGHPGSGIHLFDLFRRFPFRLTVYNVGQISSIGVTAYLGAKGRMVSRHATFLIHRTRLSQVSQGMDAVSLRAALRSMAIDDKRTEAIFAQEGIEFTPEERGLIDEYELILTADRAKSIGLSHAIGEFEPPPGEKILDPFSRL